MKTINYDKFAEYADWNVSAFRQMGLPEDMLHQIEIQKQQAQTLKQITSATGLKFDEVVVEDGPANAAAFVTRDRRSYTHINTLTNPHEAKNAGFHEREHLDNRVFDFELSSFLKPEDLSLLADQIGIPDLAKIDLVEGFNHYRTLTNTPADNTQVYRREVQAAKSLDQLAQNVIGQSLKDVFTLDQLEELQSRLLFLIMEIRIRKQFQQALAA